MNPDYNLKDYAKFPLVKKTQWKNVFKFYHLGLKDERPFIG